MMQTKNPAWAGCLVGARVPAPSGRSGIKHGGIEQAGVEHCSVSWENRGWAYKTSPPERGGPAGLSGAGSGLGGRCHPTASGQDITGPQLSSPTTVTAPVPEKCRLSMTPRVLSIQNGSSGRSG